METPWPSRPRYWRDLPTLVAALDSNRKLFPSPHAQFSLPTKASSRLPPRRIYASPACGTSLTATQTKRTKNTAPSRLRGSFLFCDLLSRISPERIKFQGALIKPVSANPVRTLNSEPSFYVIVVPRVTHPYGAGAGSRHSGGIFRAFSRPISVPNSNVSQSPSEKEGRLPFCDKHDEWDLRQEDAALQVRTTF